MAFRGERKSIVRETVMGAGARSRAQAAIAEELEHIRHAKVQEPLRKRRCQDIAYYEHLLQRWDPVEKVPIPEVEAARPNLLAMLRRARPILGHPVGW